MNRWRAFFWILVGLNGFAVAIITSLQFRSGSWGGADQIGGALGLHAVWVIPIDTLVIAALWRRAHAPSVHTSDVLSTPAVEVLGIVRAGQSIARSFRPALARCLRNRFVFGVVLATCMGLWGVVLWALLGPETPRFYSGAAFMGGDDTLHFAPTAAAIIGGEDRRKFLSKIPVQTTPRRV